MADNSNDLEVIVGLAVNESVSKIEKDLKKVQNILANNSKDGKLKIIGELDTVKTKDRIEHQLSKLKIDSSSLKITPSLDISIKDNADKVFQPLVDSAKKTSENVSKIVKEPFNLKPDDNGIKALQQSLEGLGADQKYIDETIERLSKLSFTIDKLTYSFSQSERNGTTVLGSLSAIGTDNLGNDISYIETFNKKTGEFVQANTKYVVSLEERRATEEKLAKSSSETTTTLTANSNKQLEQAAKYMRQMEDVYRSVTDVNGTKPISWNIDLEAIYKKATNAVNEYAQASKEGMSEAKIKVEDYIAELKRVIKETQNAEYAASSLRAKDFATVKTDTLEDINKFKQQVKNALGSTTPLAKEIEELDKAFDNLESADKSTRIEALTNVLNKLSNAQSRFDVLKEVQKDFNGIEKEAQSAITTIDRFNKSAQFRNNNLDERVAETTKDLADFRNKYEEILNELAKNTDSKGLEKIRNNLVELNKGFNEAKDSAQRLKDTLANQTAEMNTERRFKTLIAQVKEYMAQNTKAAQKYKAQFEGILSQEGIRQTSTSVNELTMQFRSLRSEIKLNGDEGTSLFEKIKKDVSKFTSWLSITTVVSTGVRDIRKMIQEVIKLDNSLLELSKVSDLSANGIKNVTKEAFELSKQVGKTGTDVIDAVTNFKRAGFELQDSMALAKDALVLTNVAEGIDDAGEAATALISIMKGYGDTSTDFAQKILDAVNEVSNTQAIDFDSLIDGSQRLAAVAKQGGASFEQMLGILTGTNEVLQNIEKTSSGAITIFTRLQSVQLPDEEDVLPLAKLQETFNKNTNGMVNIIDQTTGELRNVYDILNDISEVWDTLDKNTQEGLAFAAAGTRQKNVFLSMMENWENVKKSVESANNSIGSATEENQKYLDSISGRLSVVESNFQSLSNTVINSDLVKFLVSGAGGALGLLDNIISKFGTLQTLLPIIMGSLSAFRNVGRAKTSALKMEYADCNVVVTRNELIA